MITVPTQLKIGQYFYNEDVPGDVGIYKVREWEKGDGSRTHLYVGSVDTVSEAIEKCSKLNGDFEAHSNSGERPNSLEDKI